MKNSIFLIGLFLFAVSACMNQPRLEMSRTDEPVTLEAGADAFFITVDSIGEIWIDNQVVDPNVIASRFEESRGVNPDLPVVVNADENSPTSVIVRILEAAELSAIENVSIVALE